MEKCPRERSSSASITRTLGLASPGENTMLFAASPPDSPSSRETDNAPAPEIQALKNETSAFLSDIDSGRLFQGRPCLSLAGSPDINTLNPSIPDPIKSLSDIIARTEQLELDKLLTNEKNCFAYEILLSDISDIGYELAMIPSLQEEVAPLAERIKLLVLNFLQQGLAQNAASPSAIMITSFDALMKETCPSPEPHAPLFCAAP